MGPAYSFGIAGLYCQSMESSQNQMHVVKWIDKVPLFQVFAWHVSTNKTIRDHSADYLVS